MREILFHGKDRITGEWIEGSLVLDKFKDLEVCSGYCAEYPPLKNSERPDEEPNSGENQN